MVLFFMFIASGVVVGLGFALLNSGVESSGGSSVTHQDRYPACLVGGVTGGASGATHADISDYLYNCFDD